MKYVSIFLLGAGILAGALLLNFIASKLGLLNWYDFLERPDETQVSSLIWLFIIYPLGLGITAYLLSKVFKIN